MEPRRIEPYPTRLVKPHPTRLSQSPKAIPSRRMIGPIAPAFRAAFVAVGCALFASCASYVDRTATAYRTFERGDFAAAEKEYAKPDTTGSKFLAGAEAGMSALVGGDFAVARTNFDQANAEVKELEDRALVSASDLGESLLSFALNDTFKSYLGEGFERVMLHGCLAITYLADGKLEDAYVEARRGNKLLESEESLYSKSYAAGGLGHFISAIAYELLDQPDDAYIDYKRMLEKDVGTEVAGRAMVRLATKLHYDSDLPELEKKFGKDAKRPDDAASIVVIAGVGEGPYKQEFGFTLPVDKGRVVQWTVPTFAFRPQGSAHVALRLGGSDDAVHTSVIEDVAKVSKENLDDRIAWLAAKSAIRAALKYKLTEELQENHGTLGVIVGDIFTVATERADLRAWQTLPNTWQAARAFVAPGTHELTLEAEGGERRVLGSFELAKGETMFVFARTIGTRLYAQSIGGRRTDAPSPTANAPANP